MKHLLLLILFLFGIFVSCKKESTGFDQCAKDHGGSCDEINYFITGYVVDSISKALISGIPIRCGAKIANNNTSDQSGLFAIHITSPAYEGKPKYLLTYNDSIYAKVNLSYDEIKLDEYNIKNIETNPFGYLQIHIKNVSGTIFDWASFTAMPHNIGEPHLFRFEDTAIDTQFVWKVLPNKLVTCRNHSNVIKGSIFVPSGDTAFMYLEY